MIIVITNETSKLETRVSATPENVKKYISKGFRVMIETNAGLASNFDDNEYISAGGEIKKNISEILPQSDILLKVKQPSVNELKYIKNSSVIIGNFQNSVTDNLIVFSRIEIYVIKIYITANILCFSKVGHKSPCPTS